MQPDKVTGQVAVLHHKFGLLTPMDAVTRSAELSARVLNAIHGYVHAGSRNELVALASYDAVREHHEAMVLLVRHKLYGSAFTLLRTMFEGCIVGLWATYLAKDPELDAFEAGRLTLEPSRVLRRLRPKDDGDYIQMLESFHERTKDSLNSYVHVGHEAVAGRVSPTHIGPNYSRDRVEAFITFADAMLIVAAMEIGTLTNDEPLRDRLNEVVASHVAKQA